MSSPVDYRIAIPVSERKAMMKELEGYMIEEMDGSDPDYYSLQGHPGMGDEFRKRFTYSFAECFTGNSIDLWVENNYVEGEWIEEYEIDYHWKGESQQEVITLEEFNTAFDHLYDDEYQLT